MSSSRLNQLQQLLLESPDDIFLHYAIGMEWLGSGQTDQAIQAFQQVLLLDPNHIPTHYQLAKIYQSIGSDQKAIQLLTNGIKLLNNTSDTRSLREFTALLEEITF